ncbi:MAG: SurA N-terminal domain-containing protein [Candidatus Omnitrophota bacterium]|nr:SurA N-terminal domain-containing protein [Candidatus Omnitrophota bacterium]
MKRNILWCRKVYNTFLILKDRPSYTFKRKGLTTENNLKKSLPKVIFLLTVMLFIHFSLHAEQVGKIVAWVNNDVITAKDLEDYYKVIGYRMPDAAANLPLDEKLAKDEALQRLIEDKLILEEAKKASMEVFPYLINNQLDKIMSSYPSREEFENSLVERGINVTLLKERIKGQYLMRQLITNRVSSYISVSPQEIATYYKEHVNEIFSPQKYAIWIVKTKDKNLLSQVTKSVKTNGIDEAKKEYGNVFANLEATAADLDEDISKTLKNLKEGEFFVKKINDENYFIYLEKIIAAQQLSLEQANEKIYSIIWDAKFKKRFQEWVKELREKAVIVTYSSNS